MLAITTRQSTKIDLPRRRKPSRRYVGRGGVFGQWSRSKHELGALRNPLGVLLGAGSDGRVHPAKPSMPMHPAR